MTGVQTCALPIFGFPFPFTALEPAIAGYRKGRRFEDALRIILPITHLPAALACFKDDAFAKTAEAYFLEKFNAGFERHNASYALAKLHSVTGDTIQMRRWADTALTFAEQPQKRKADIHAMLAAE